MAELPQDVSLRSKIDSQRLLPPGIVTREGDTTDTRSSGDRVLGWTGPGVYDCDWVDIADIVGSAITGGIAISALPAAGALDGTELVPVVQSGATVRTTTQDIADLGGGGGGYWQYGVTGTDILDVAAGTQATMEQFLVHVDNTGGILGLTVHDTQLVGGGAGDYELGVTLGAFGPRVDGSGSPLGGTLDLTSESLTTGAYSEVFLASSINTGFVAHDMVSANGDFEAYHDQFADNSSAWFEFIAIGSSGNNAEIDIHQSGGIARIDFYADKTRFHIALPSSDPGVVGELYEVAGVVMISL